MGIFNCRECRPISAICCYCDHKIHQRMNEVMWYWCTVKPSLKLFTVHYALLPALQNINRLTTVLDMTSGIASLLVLALCAFSPIHGLKCHEGFDMTMNGIPLYYWKENECSGNSKCVGQRLTMDTDLAGRCNDKIFFTACVHILHKQSCTMYALKILCHSAVYIQKTICI